eukprot:120564-Chlamydomonas_euryale.AAC.2
MLALALVKGGGIQSHKELQGAIRSRKETRYSLLFTYFTYTGFSGCNNFHISFHQVTIIAKSTIIQAWTWIHSTLGCRVAHWEKLHNISHSRHGGRKTVPSVSYVQPFGASLPGCGWGADGPGRGRGRVAPSATVAQRSHDGSRFRRRSRDRWRDAGLGPPA